MTYLSLNKTEKREKPINPSFLLKKDFSLRVNGCAKKEVEVTSKANPFLPYGFKKTTRNNLAPTPSKKLRKRNEKKNLKLDIKKKDFKKKYSIKSKKKIKGVLGKVYCNSTKNNTILSLIDSKGNTKGWSCSGSLGFKNARKSTTYAAQAAAESIIKKAKVLGYTHLRLRVKGLGRGKQSCLRALSKSGLKIISLEDKTSLPYNGCRSSKKRRV